MLYNYSQTSVKLIADSRINVTFDTEISQHLIELAKATKQSVQRLAGKLIRRAIDEVEDIALSQIVDECDTPDMELIRSQDIDWNTVLKDGA